MTTLIIFQIIIAILLTVVILSQQQGVGLGGVFGGEGSVHRARRGVEKWLYYLTIILAIIFFGSAIVSVILF